MILKSPTELWENKRVKHQMKFKNVLEADLLCTDWIVSEDNKYEGMLGSITVQNRDGSLTVNVGSGFSDMHRRTIKKEDIVGKIVAVKYNALSKTKKGARSLFLPIFVEIREDKNEADDL